MADPALDQSRFEIINGTGYWFDVIGNVVASQDPGGPVIFTNDASMPASTVSANKNLLTLAILAGVFLMLTR